MNKDYVTVAAFLSMIFTGISVSVDCIPAIIIGLVINMIVLTCAIIGSVQSFRK